MLKVLAMIVTINLCYADPLTIDSSIIFDGVIDTIKRVPENLSNLGNHIYKREVKNEKSYWWYFKKNSKLKTLLSKRKINYHTILKQGMYPLKTYDNSREAEIKKYAILMALAKENGIITEETHQAKHQKKKLHIEMTDINKIKKN